MSGLHRDINVPRNYLTSRRLQKAREGSGGRTGPGTRCPPSCPGRLPTSGVQTRLSLGKDLHRPKGSRITIQSMSVSSNGPYSLEGTIKPDPLVPIGESLSTLIHYSSREKKPLIKVRATTTIRHLDYHSYIGLELEGVNLRLVSGSVKRILGISLLFF